jgi:tetratricopeptide (TPR) repeat protein
MKLFQFPHFSRLFSAFIRSRAVSSLLWSGFAALLVMNIQMKLAYQNALNTIISTVYLEANADKQVLANRFIDGGRTPVAQELLQSAGNGTNQSSGKAVLGAQTQGLPYWSRVISEKPDYRDAYFQAAKSAMELKQWDTARIMIQQAQTLDPNNHQASVLLSILAKETK